MDDSQIEKEHVKHIQLIFKKFRQAGIKLKISKCEFFKSQIEYLGHLVSGQEISPMKQKVEAIMGLVPATNSTEACHIFSLISYYRKFFPVFSAMVQPLNELTKKNVPFK